MAIGGGWSLSSLSGLYFLASTSGLAYHLNAFTHNGALQLDMGSKGRAFLQSGDMQRFSDVLAQDISQVARVFLRSELAMFILINWMFAAYSVVALATTAVFLGRLTQRESRALTDRLLKFLIFKFVFVSALLPPGMGEVAAWIGWFAVAGFMRIFMGVARDRLEGLMAAPNASLFAHVRAVSLVLLIMAHDAAAVTSLVVAANTHAGVASGAAYGLPFLTMDMSRALLCLFDMAVIAVEGAKTLIRYGVHLVDLSIAARGAAAAEAGVLLPASVWEGKGGVLYHVELVSDVLIHTLTITHYIHVWYLHGLSFTVVDGVLLLDVRAVVASLVRRIKGYMSYREATHRLQHAFPDARPAEPEPCSICMETMACAKQLPCGHLFHLSCLRAWMQQGGADTFTCPNCRQPMVVSGPPGGVEMHAAGGGMPGAPHAGMHPAPGMPRGGRVMCWLLYVTAAIIWLPRRIHTFCRNAVIYVLLRLALVILGLSFLRRSSDPVVVVYVRHLRATIRRAAAHYAPTRGAAMAVLAPVAARGRTPPSTEVARERGARGRSRSTGRRSPEQGVTNTDAEGEGENTHPTPGRAALRGPLPPRDNRTLSLSLFGWWQVHITLGYQMQGAGDGEGPEAGEGVEGLAARQARRSEHGEPVGAGRQAEANGAGAPGTADDVALGVAGVLGEPAAMQRSGPVTRARAARAASGWFAGVGGGEGKQRGGEDMGEDAAAVHVGHRGCRCIGCLPLHCVQRVRGQAFARVTDIPDAPDTQGPGAAGPSGQLEAGWAHTHLSAQGFTEAGPRPGVGLRRVRAHRLMPPVMPDLPTWSGQAANQLAHHVAQRVHSTLSHAGCSAAALGGSDQGEEVCSVRRDLPHAAHLPAVPEAAAS